MKKIIYTSVALSALCCSFAKAQNYIDNYLSGTPTYTTIASSANGGILAPRDLDFNPNTNELWVALKGNTNGGQQVIIYNAGLTGQTTKKIQDSHNGHFNNNTSGIAFGNQGEWANSAEYKQGAGTFQGPSLWDADTAITAKVFQNNWVTGLPLGSHLDMLHQSPYSMGIAWEVDNTYWLFDGYNGTICKYQYVQHHGVGYDDHSAGKIWRMKDPGAAVTRVTGVPSHMVVDQANNWLYFIDGGSKTLKRLKTNTGTSALQADPSNESLAGYYFTTGVTIETIETFTSQPCGIDYNNNRLIVSHYGSGDITVYNTATSTPTKLGTIATGVTGIMGVKIGTDGKIWFVNNTGNTVVRINPASASANDAGIQKITSPVLNPAGIKFYSPKFNECGAGVTPTVTLINSGSNTLTSVTINYKVDVAVAGPAAAGAVVATNGAVSTYNWTGSLAPGATTSVTLPLISVPTGGRHKLTVYTSNPNGTTDPNTANNTRVGYFRMMQNASYPFTENFTSTTFPPANWDVVGFNVYCFYSRATVGKNAAGSAKMGMWTTHKEDKRGQIDYLITPSITVPSVSNNSLKFNVANARFNFTDNTLSTPATVTSNDKLEVRISDNCGATWSTVYSKSGADLATVSGNIQTSFTPTSTQWRSEYVNLSSYANKEVILMFVLVSGNGNNTYIDDIELSNSTGVQENSNSIDQAIEVYPNPATDRFVVSANTQPDLLEGATLTIYNSVGQVVSKQQLVNQSLVEVDLSGFTNGFYFVNLNTKQGDILRKLVVSK